MGRGLGVGVCLGGVGVTVGVAVGVTVGVAVGVTVGVGVGVTCGQTKKISIEAVGTPVLS